MPLNFKKEEEGRLSRPRYAVKHPREEEEGSLGHVMPLSLLEKEGGSLGLVMTLTLIEKEAL